MNEYIKNNELMRIDRSQVPRQKDLLIAESIILAFSYQYSVIFRRFLIIFVFLLIPRLPRAYYEPNKKMKTNAA